MYYIIGFSEIPEDLTKVIDSYLLAGLKIGPFLYIKRDSLVFFRAYNLPLNDTETIDVDKLKELLLLKHLEE